MDEHQVSIESPETKPIGYKNEPSLEGNPTQNIQQQLSILPDWYYELDPAISKLYDHDPTVRYEAVLNLHPKKNRTFVNQLRHFQLDPAYPVRREVQNKLNSIESFYRRKFYFFQKMMKKKSNYAGYRLGFALTCLRYAQNWVQSAKLQDYFLHEALGQLNRLIRTVEPKKIYFYYRGQVFKAMNQISLAIEDFRKVREIDPKHRGAILQLLDSYIKSKQPHKSNELVRITVEQSHPTVFKNLLTFWEV